MRQIKSHFIFLLMFGLLLGSQPTVAESKEDTKQFSTANLLVQNKVRVTDIQLDNTNDGLQLIIKTVGGQRLVPLILPEGNKLVIDLTDAELDLTMGSNYREINPAPGIKAIAATQENNDIRIVITGEENAPSAEVVSSRQGLVLSVETQGNTAQTEPDEEIEVIATGEGEDSDYVVTEATSATRTDTPILDSSQSVQVIIQRP